MTDTTKNTGKDQQASPRKSGCGPALFILLLLIGATAGTLHYLGKLQSVIEYGRDALAKVRKTIPEPAPEKPEPAKEDKSQAVAGKETEKPKTDTAKESKSPAVAVKDLPKAAPAAIQPAKAMDAGPAAMYRARFKPPKVGSEITLTMKGGQKVTGTFVGLDETSIQISRENATITLDRNQLAPIAVARCYPEEYVKYMMALDGLRAVEEKAMNEELARLKVEYEQQREKQTAALATQKANTSRPRPVKGSTDDGDFKKWMEQHGESDFFKARKQRIEEYEKQRIAEGREY